MAAIEMEGNDPQRTESPVVNTAKNYEIVLEPVPVKRKNRARKASLAIFSIIAILVLVFCVMTRTVDEYHPDTSSRYTQNTTIIYLRNEKDAYPDLFITALSLLSVVIGTVVDRFSLVFEERHHLNERYGGSHKKMIKACFSGIQKGPVILLSILALVIVALLILLTDMPYFEVRYLVTIFGGIGVGPLVMHLLNLNTQSEVHISTILEEREMYVANGLAWSYYINYLNEALPQFKEMIKSSPQIALSLDKLLLLVLDCPTEDDLTALDRNIEKLNDIRNDQDTFRFPVYQLKINEDEHKHFAIQYVKEPLRALAKMSKLEDPKAVRKQTYDAEVKLLYRTLLEIIKNPPDERCSGTCILVPIKATKLERLNNGGLVDAIMNVVKSSHTHTDGASQSGASGFHKLATFRYNGKTCIAEDNPCGSNKASKKTTQGVKTKSSNVTTNNDHPRNGENINPGFHGDSVQKGNGSKRKQKGKSGLRRSLIDPVAGEGDDEGAGISGYDSQMDPTANGNQPTD